MVATDDSLQTAQLWQDKYYDSLETIEKKEKHWAEVEDLLRRALSRLTLAAEGMDEALDHQLKELRDAIRDREDSPRLSHHIEAMTRTLVKLDEARSRQARATPMPQPHPLRRLLEGLHLPRGTGLRTEEALLRLLEQFELPTEYAARVEALQDRLENPVPGRDWPALLEEIAALVREVRQRIQAEKKELETFLRTLTERLQEVDAQLQGSESLREARLQSSRELDAAVKQEVRGMESRVQAAEELNQLKCELQGHLDNIVTRLEQHQREEEQCHQQAREEMSRLQTRLQTMEEEAERLRARAREERRQAMTDSLTGIPNRSAFEERMAEEYARWKRLHTPLALLLWDVDKFKDINDHYGHKAGDRVLRTLARTLRNSVRETDFLARFGGEEFVLLVTGAETPMLHELADKLRNAVAACGFHFRGTSVQVTISCGIASFGANDTPETVFDRADRALYRAKEQGRDRCELAQI